MVAGHNDGIGGDAYNQKSHPPPHLRAGRAGKPSSAIWSENNTLSPMAISSQSYGKTKLRMRPSADTANRRVQVVTWKPRTASNNQRVTIR